MKPRHKFGAIQTIRDGMKFPSKREARYYDQLKLEVKTGLVSFFLRQVPFHLPGGIKFVLDFLVFRSDGTVELIDTKGRRTPQYIDKKKLVEALYPVEIIER